MSESSWESGQKNRFKKIKWFAVIIPALLIAGVILYNNREFLGQKAGPEARGFPKPDSTPDEKTLKEALGPPITDSIGEGTAMVPRPAQVSSVTASKKETRRDTMSQVSTSPAAPKAPAKANAAVRCDSLPLSDIDCTIMDRKDLAIHISLLLYIDNCDFRQDILMKREDLKVIVKNTLKKKEFGSVRTEPLRAELLAAMNTVLDKSAIGDLVFKDFRIEEVSK